MAVRLGAAVSPPSVTLDPSFSTGIEVPEGALNRWFAYATPANTSAERREVVVFGDSTTFGSGPDPGYSWMQRLRDRIVGAGLADGGKGFHVLDYYMGYDAPEVVSFVAEGTTFSDGNNNNNDPVDGGYATSNIIGQVQNFQFRSTALRLWYTRGPAGGSFTYAVNGGSPVSVNSYRAGEVLDEFVWIGGLAADTTHTLQVQVVNGLTSVTPAPVNTVGVALQKVARSGHTLAGQFHGGVNDTHHEHRATRYQSMLGLVPTAGKSPQSPRWDYDGFDDNNVVDTSHPFAERVRPVLAMCHLGFNDLQTWTDEYLVINAIRKFAAACRAASCDGIVISGQLPYSYYWTTRGVRFFNLLRHYTLTNGLAFVDFFVPIGGPSLDYTGGETNPHLNRPQYEAQADYLWDELLGL